jgi:hypothetical protein
LPCGYWVGGCFVSYENDVGLDWIGLGWVGVDLLVPWDPSNHSRFPKNVQEIIKAIISLTCSSLDDPSVPLFNTLLALLPMEMVAQIINHLLVAMSSSALHRTSTEAITASSTSSSNKHYRRFDLS